MPAIHDDRAELTRCVTPDCRVLHVGEDAGVRVEAGGDGLVTQGAQRSIFPKVRARRKRRAATSTGRGTGRIALDRIDVDCSPDGGDR